VSVVRTFARFRPFTIQLEGGARRSFDSLLFANIAEMAKYATLSEAGRPDDGRFEVITLPRTAKWRILGVAVRAVTRGLGPQPTAEHYAFTTLKPIPLQLDGELLTLDAATPVRIDIAPPAPWQPWAEQRTRAAPGQGLGPRSEPQAPPRPADSAHVIAPDLLGRDQPAKPSTGAYSLGAYPAGLRDLLVMLAWTGPPSPDTPGGHRAALSARRGPRADRGRRPKLGHPGRAHSGCSRPVAQ
jgi:hypothetical protein